MAIDACGRGHRFPVAPRGSLSDLARVWHDLFISTCRLETLVRNAGPVGRPAEAFYGPIAITAGG